MLLSYTNYYNDTRMHLSLDKMRPYRGPLRRQGAFFAVQFSADCITNRFGAE